MAFTGEITHSSIEPDYNPINRELEATLIQEALAENHDLAKSDSQFAVLTLKGNSPYSNLARSLERQIFDHYFQNSAEEMKKEYGQYENASSFFLMVDRENLQPAAVMRIIHPNERGFKSLNDLNATDEEGKLKCSTPEGNTVTGLSMEEIAAEFDMATNNVLDIATIAAHPNYGESARGDPVALASLMRTLYKYSNQNGYDELIAIIDKKPREILEGVGMPISKSPNIASPFSYLGAEGNTFIHISVPEVEPAMKAINPQVYEFVYGETGLQGTTELSLQEQ